MNRQYNILVFVALVAVIVSGRMLPHVPNFAPVAAAGLLAGYALRPRLLAAAVPLVGMLISDFMFVGTYGWQAMAFVYAGLIAPVLMGAWLRKPARLSASAPVWQVRAVRVLKLMGTASFASLFFFALSNLGTWLFSGMYAMNWAGFTACYAAALPFLKSTLAADLVFSCALFGAWHIVRSIAPQAQLAKSKA